MATTVTTTGTGQLPLRRAAVKAGRVVGGLLLIAATIASVPAGWIAILAAVQHLPQGGQPLRHLPPLISRHLLSIWLTSVVAVFTWPLAIRLVRIDRRAVLFLRRFGDTEATRVVTDAAWRIGASWRMMTLDDEEVAPVGNDPRATMTSRAVLGIGHLYYLVFTKPAPTLKAVSKFTGWCAGILAVVLFALSHGSVSHRINNVLEYNGVAGWILKILIYILAICLGMVFVAAWAMVVMVVTLPAWMIIAQAATAVKTTEARLKTVAIKDEKAINSISGMIRRYSHRALTTRLVILTVESAIWQPTVIAVAKECAVALVDISDVSPNVFWEIQRLSELGKPVVYVGEQSRVAYLAAKPDGDLNLAPVRALLNGQTVIAYTNDAAGRRRFGKVLQSTFYEQVRRASR